MTGLELLQRIAEEQQVMGDDCKCEASPDAHNCSIHVTHRGVATCCTFSLLECEEAVRVDTEFSRTGLCIKCRRPASLCWRFIPI